MKLSSNEEQREEIQDLLNKLEEPVKIFLAFPLHSLS